MYVLSRKYCIIHHVPAKITEIMRFFTFGPKYEIRDICTNILVM